MEHLHDYYTAIETYSQLIELDPDNALAYHRRGLARAATGDILGKISDLNPELSALLQPILDKINKEQKLRLSAQSEAQLAPALRGPPLHLAFFNPTNTFLK